MCTTCHRDAFALLSQPYDGTPHMHRCMRVAHRCRRCYAPGYFPSTALYMNRARAAFNAALCAWDPCINPDHMYGGGVLMPPELYDTTIMEVFLPTEILAAAASLVGKSGATHAYGAKPPNDWLQIANLVSQRRRDDANEDLQHLYALALSTVGAAAIEDEILCSAPPVTCYDCFLGGDFAEGLGYSWKHVERGGAIPRAIQDAMGTDATSLVHAFAGTRPAPNRPNVGLPKPVPPPPPGLEQLAAEATDLDQQMGAHVDGTLLHSTVVINEHGEHVQDNRTASGDVGARTARTRFPKTSPVKEYLFSNDPENLISAEAMRNVGVGVADLSPEQSKAFDEAVSALKKHLFTKNRVQKAERFITQTTNVLPKNRTNEQRMQMHIDALNATGDETVPFSLLVDAFCKKEVTKKLKPRPIANHGNARVWGMAKPAAIFEDVMFHNLPFACIKDEEKSAKMNELFSGLDACLHKIENDLTAFEFGIYDRLKKAECEIFKHIMGHLNLDPDNAGFCYRVVNARTQACTWVLRYTDAAGAKCQLKLELPRTMRESGDRITSSGNFFQNLLAWLTLLVKPGKVEAAVQSLIQHKGKLFYYTSARDGRQYKAVLAFEGDDTLGSLDEKILVCNDGQLIDEFFTEYGWKAKLKVASNKGDACIQFVGYTALLRDGKIVRDRENVVMFPEIKRILQDKPWSSTDIPDEEYHPSVAVYATCMANEFRYFGPMHAFFSAMRADHIAKGGSVRRSNAMLRDIYIKMYGDVGTEEQVLSNVPEIQPFLDGVSAYQDLARVHAGDFSAEEYAAMCGLTTLEMHGRDLACFIPRAWLCSESICLHDRMV